MKTKNGTMIAATLTAFCMVPLALAPMARAAASKDAEPTATQDVEWGPELSPSASAAVSLAAGRVLKHTDAARQALAASEKDDATAQVDQALTLLRIIEGALPVDKVTTDISAGDATYHAEDQETTRYVPIFDELSIVDVVTPVEQARAEAAMATPAGDDAAKSAEAKPAKPEGLDDYSAVRHTFLTLDRVVAQRALSQAKAALGKDETEAADSALLALQTRGVTFQVTEVELPLVEAADDLTLAQVEIDQGDAAAARESLARASGRLEAYATMSGDARSHEVKTLRRDLDELTKQIDGADASVLASAKDRVHTWWSQVTDWVHDR